MLLILLPQLSNPSAGLPVLAIALLKSIVFLALMFLLGTRLLPRLLAIIAHWNSRELFLLTIIAIGLGIGYATYLIDLSFAFGAFVAGMVLSESDYGYQALSDIIPLRDLFGLLFFTSVGMLLNPVFLLENWSGVLLLVVLVAIGKSLILAVIVRSFGYGNVIPLAVGLGMFQIGEFSFVLGRVGVEGGFLSLEQYSYVLTATIISMLLTPMISALTAPLYGLKQRYSKKELLETINIPQGGLHDHIVIAGGGRVGQHVAHILAKLEVPFVIIDLGHRTIDEYKQLGYPAIYGDAAQPVVLEAANLVEAKQLLITIPHIMTTETIVHFTRKHYPDLNIIVRSGGSEQMEALYADGVYMVICPELEAGLETARQVLLEINVSVPVIQKFIDAARRDHYQSLSDDQTGLDNIRLLQKSRDLLELSWQELNEENYMVGSSLRQLDIRQSTGASVVGVLRNGVFTANPSADLVFHAGDLIASIGHPQKCTWPQEMTENG